VGARGGLTMSAAELLHARRAALSPLPPRGPPAAARRCWPLSHVVRPSAVAGPRRRESRRPALPAEKEAAPPRPPTTGDEDTAATTAPSSPPPSPPPSPLPWYASPYDAEIGALAGPTLVALAADPLLSVVDTVLAGALGPGPLAALGLNAALFTFAFVVFNFLASATTPLVAAADAAGDADALGRVTLDAAALALGLGTAVAAALWLGADPALALMGAPPPGSPDPDGVASAAKAYLMWRAGAAPAALAMTAGQGVCRGLKDGRTPLAVAAAANGAHALLAPALMFGPPHMGVAGAAAATFVAEWGAAVAYGVLLWRRRGRLGLDPWPARWRLGGGGGRGGDDGNGTPSPTAGPFAAAGGAVLARSALLLGTKTLAAASAARLGTVPMAAHQVLMQLWLLASFAVDSLAVSGQALVAGALARGDAVAARGVADRLLQLGVAAGGGLAAVLLAGGAPARRLFTADPAVDAALAALMPLAAGVLPLNAAVYVLDGVLLGAGDFAFLAVAMAGAAGVSAAALLAGPGAGIIAAGGGGGTGESLDHGALSGLTGVWVALVGLMAARAATLAWRYQSAGGPVPPVVGGGGGGAAEAAEGGEED
jgi:Na+-driven multidrug efflux pump